MRFGERDKFVALKFFYIKLTLPIIMTSVNEQLYSFWNLSRAD